MKRGFKRLPSCIFIITFFLTGMCLDKVQTYSPEVHSFSVREADSDLFGNEKDDSFKGSIGNIYQSFAGQDIYPTLEEKAANLLYFITKNHSFSDGNKRIAATMFLYFLDKNDILFADGNKLIDDHTLVALTIMIAESKPDEKEMMISLIMNCICG